MAGLSTRISWCIVAYSCALPLIAGCAGTPGPSPIPSPTGERVSREPQLRIGLQPSTTHVTLLAQGAVDVRADGRRLYRMRSGSAVNIEASAGGLRVVGDEGRTYGSMVFESLDRDRHLLVDGAPYRGIVEVMRRSGGAATVVNRVEMEDYLRSVVAVEMGRRSANERAALEAQAVASRTYALKNRGKFESEGYDLRASVSDQLYRGAAAERDDATRAVQRTTGEVLVYDGRLIAAFFHSTCGEATAAPEEVFRSVADVAYLQPVSDGNGDGFYGDISPHFHWTVEWNGTQLLETLRQTVPQVLGVDAAAIDGIRDVYVRALGPSGRATEVRIVVGSGEIPVFGPDVRAVFRAPDGRPLASNAVRFTAAHEGDRVSLLTAHGTGYGHGVGLCQWGAIGRARSGQDYRRILTTYFPGAHIERWY